MLAGLPRFPAYQNKHPACGSWPRDARVGATIPTGLLTAVPTGAASGLAVLDVDLAGLGWFRGQHNRMPATRTHHTRSGGRHLVFRHREGLRNSQSAIAPGVDVRAEGGYVIWWPQKGLAVEHDGVIAEWPDWLVPITGQRTKPPNGHLFEIPLRTTIKETKTEFSCFRRTVPRTSFEGTVGWSASNRAFQNVSCARTGQRNYILNGEGYALGRIVVRGWLAGDYAVYVLAEGAKACRYVGDHGEADTVKAIRHALLDGMRNPYPDVVSRSQR